MRSWRFTVPLKPPCHRMWNAGRFLWKTFREGIAYMVAQKHLFLVVGRHGRHECAWSSARDASSGFLRVKFCIRIRPGLAR